MPYGQDAYKLQVQHFMNEMAAHQSLRKMRSYMCLYTSIDVEKLASFNDMKVDEFEPWLVCYKHKMRQFERGASVKSSPGENASKEVVKGAKSDQDKIGTGMDIHYYLAGNVVHVDEAEKTRRFENYFMKQISHNEEILKSLQKIRVEI